MIILVKESGNFPTRVVEVNREKKGPSPVDLRLNAKKDLAEGHQAKVPDVLEEVEVKNPSNNMGVMAVKKLKLSDATQFIPIEDCRGRAAVTPIGKIRNKFEEFPLRESS